MWTFAIGVVLVAAAGWAFLQGRKMPPAVQSGEDGGDAEGVLAGIAGPPPSRSGGNAKRMEDEE